MKNKKIALIGLGYVGLPLAVAHDEFKSLTEDQIRTYGKDKCIV